MLTLLGSLLGFGTSFLPKVMDYFQDRQDKAHELDMMDKQLASQVAIGVQKLEAVGISADADRFKAVQKSASTTQKFAHKWSATYSSTVRPTITYMFMCLFIFVEISAYLLLLDHGVAAGDAAAQVWTIEIQALFATIISFWFGGRMIRK